MPQRPNLHWLGGRDYALLPAYVKGFDVCLMPFAINEATEYINPTKALEYMATGRPIVSTRGGGRGAAIQRGRENCRSHARNSWPFAGRRRLQPDTAAHPAGP